MANGNVTTSTAAVFIPEMWRDAILNYAERQFRLRNQVTDFSSMLSSGGDILHIPRVTEESAVAKSAGGAVTYTNNTDVETQLTVDQHWYNAKRVDDIVRVQESADLFNQYTRAMGYALAKKVESYIAGIIQSATQNDVTLASDNVFTTALLRSGLQKLLDANHDYTDGEHYLYASPAAYMSLLSLGDFTEAQKRGDDENPLVSGMIMQAYGLSLFSSTDWDDDGDTGDETASIFNRDSIYYAQQIAPRVQSEYDIDYLATSVVADTLFGACLAKAANDASNGIVNFNNPS
jgi:hypothetical protein|tara:strand:+ start:6509 stop:7381 length:873 start_codon:yes stop_codon:yes gene_type:complete